MPDFGVTGTGTAWGLAASQFTYVEVTNTYAASGGETLSSASLRCNTDSGTEAVDLGVYTIDTAGDGDPDTVVSSATANNATTTEAWVTATLSGTLSASTTYAAAFENNATNNFNYRYSSGSPGDSEYESGVFPSPWTSTSTLNRIMSVYATYSTGGGGTILPFRMRY